MQIRMFDELCIQTLLATTSGCHKQLNIVCKKWKHVHKSLDVQVCDGFYVNTSSYRVFLVVVVENDIYKQSYRSTRVARHRS